MSRWVAIDSISLTRSSISTRCAMYIAVAGIFARSASSTELRPVTVSVSVVLSFDRALRFGLPPEAGRPPGLPFPPAAA